MTALISKHAVGVCLLFSRLPNSEVCTKSKVGSTDELRVSCHVRELLQQELNFLLLALRNRCVRWHEPFENVHSTESVKVLSMCLNITLKTWLLPSET